MRTLVAVVLLAVGALAAPFAPAASAAAPGPADIGCSFTSVTDNDPEAPDDSQLGFLYGGPIVQNGTLTCTIKVGVGTHDGAYANGASASGTGTYGVTVLAPTVVSYVSTRYNPVYFCEQFTDAGGVTYYWDGSPWGGYGGWTTDSGADCSLVGDYAETPEDPTDFLFEYFEYIDTALIGIGQELDRNLCPVLATLPGTYGPVLVNAQGDVYLAGDPFWDCPPYDIDW